MNPFELPASGVTTMPLHLYGHIVEILTRLAAAALLSAFVAYRPWRRLMRKCAPIARDTAQAQIIIAVAGAVMVVIIGDSMARAFGLVGLGAFIRFRSGIKDPRDAAVMFVMIGIGMAVGLGLVPIAILTTTFVAVVLSFLDAWGPEPTRRLRVGIELDQARGSIPGVRPCFPGATVLHAPNVAAGEGRLVIEIDASADLDAAGILARLEESGVSGIRTVSLLDD